MTLQDWGAIGELISAIAVVVTLIYLAKEIRVNTHALDEGRKLALAQTYQMRADALQAMLVDAADSEHVGPIIIKLTGLGYPEDVSALARLDETEWRRFRMWQITADALGQHALPVSARVPRSRILRGRLQGSCRAARRDLEGARAHERTSQLLCRDRTAES